MLRRTLLVLALLLPATFAWAQEQVVTTPPPPSDMNVTATEFVRFPASEAIQGVAVDDKYAYAINNFAIGKYDKKTGKKVAEWRGERGGVFKHLDGGVVIDGKLVCPHSNFPEVPMMSSIEVFDCATLKPLSSHSFGIYEGSCTWVDWHDNSWWVCFAHYNTTGGTPGKNNAYTSLVHFDKNWNRIEAWGFPPALLERWQGLSSSGGIWGQDGLLYTTGHDAQEVYVLRIPKHGLVLEWIRTFAFPGEGQGLTFDRTEKTGILYGISRRKREIMGCRISNLQ